MVARPKPVRTPSVPSNGAGQNTNKPSFESPYKPPAGYDDLAADADPPEWYHETLAGHTWRVSVPSAQALHAFSMAVSTHNKNASLRLRMMKTFIAQHMHPDDFETMLLLMMRPGSEFREAELRRMIRIIATRGTARPFVPW